MFMTLFLIFLLIAGFALIYWGITKLTLPPMVQIVIIVGMGLLALWFIYTLVANHGHINFG